MPSMDAWWHKLSAPGHLLTWTPAQDASGLTGSMHSIGLIVPSISWHCQWQLPYAFSSLTLRTFIGHGAASRHMDWTPNIHERMQVLVPARQHSYVQSEEKTSAH